MTIYHIVTVAFQEYPDGTYIWFVNIIVNGERSPKNSNYHDALTYLDRNMRAGDTVSMNGVTKDYEEYKRHRSWQED